MLPQSLLSLTFGVKFNQKINANVLPNHLQSLKFGLHFKQKINMDFLPLTTLQIIMVNKIFGFIFLNLEINYILI